MTVGQSQFIAPFSAHTCHGRQFEGLTPKPQTQICHSIHHDEGRRRGTPSSSVWSVVASMLDSWMLSPPVLFAVLLLREGGGRLGESGCVDACVGVGVEGRGGGWGKIRLRVTPPGVFVFSFLFNQWVRDNFHDSRLSPGCHAFVIRRFVRLLTSFLPLHLE